MNRYLSIMSKGCVSPSREPQWTDAVPAALKRRDPRIWQMAYVAAIRALEQVAEKPNAIVIGTALGALDETKGVLDGVYGDGFPSPRNFIASVHNSMAGKLALELKIAGPNLTVCDGQNTTASALATADLLNESDFPVLLLLIDERIPLLDQLHPHLSEQCKNYLVENWEDAAVAFVIGTEQTPEYARVRSFGPVPTSGEPKQACLDLAHKNISINISHMLFEKSSTSFIQPALTLYDCLTEGEEGTVVIGSYSPASRGTSILELNNE